MLSCSGMQWLHQESAPGTAVPDVSSLTLNRALEAAMFGCTPCGVSGFYPPARSSSFHWLWSAVCPPSCCCHLCSSILATLTSTPHKCQLTVSCCGCCCQVDGALLLLPISSSLLCSNRGLLHLIQLPQSFLKVDGCGCTSKDGWEYLQHEHHRHTRAMRAMPSHFLCVRRMA